MKVIVENLGAVKKAEIDLSKDLLIFTGENNSGKTYLAYAVYAAVTQNMALRTEEDKTEIEFSKMLQNIFFKSVFAVDEHFFATLKIDVKFGEEMESKVIRHIEDSKNVFMQVNPKRKTIFFPSMREGISLFHKELSLIKGKVVDGLTNNQNTDYWESIIKRINRFPKPIAESLEFAQNLDDIHKDKSEFAYLADKLELLLLDGTIEINEFGNIQYKLQNNKILDLNMTSSTVKSLSYLLVYLRHIAQKGDFIIIDEPE